MALGEVDVKRQIKKNRSVFERMVRTAEEATSDSRRVQLVSQAVIFTIDNIPGVFNSPELENILLEVARKYSVPLAGTFRKNEVLHVMSRAYVSGGHTRVTERWIEAAPADEMHSVVLTGQGDRPVPERLRQAVSLRGGRFVNLKVDFPIQRALELRKLGSQFERIVLNVHPNDVTPILAFGTNDFTRPVTLFNQADHLLWLGVSIADAVVNLRSFTSKLNEQWRGIKTTFLLPLPVQDFEQNEVPAALKEERKSQLGYAPSTKLVVSMASGYKFRPFAGIDFGETASSIIKLRSDIRFLVIGPSPDEAYWKSWSTKTSGAIKAVGVIPNAELSKYLEAADYAIESFPLGSPTALLDCARYGLPCVSLRTPTNWYDAFEQAGVAVSSTEELAQRVVSEIDFGLARTNELAQIVKKEASPAAFSAKLSALKAQLPTSHAIHPFSKDTRTEPSDFEVFNNFSLMLKNRTARGKVQILVRTLVYFYVRHLFPFGMTKRMHGKLTAYGIL